MGAATHPVTEPDKVAGRTVYQGETSLTLLRRFLPGKIYCPGALTHIVNVWVSAQLNMLLLILEFFNRFLNIK